MNLPKTIAAALLFSLTLALPAFAATRGSMTLSPPKGQVAQSTTVVDVAWKGKRGAPQRKGGLVRISVPHGQLSAATLDAWRDDHTRIPSLALTVQSGGEGSGKPVVYLKYKLDRCFIKSWSTSGDADDIVLEYGTFKTVQ
ncbi:MAG: hypothetical protein AAF721_23570 [Myxococcota bacterium]